MKHITLITGATSGFGEAAARKFAALGHALILTGRRQDRLDALKASLEASAGVPVRLLHFDVRDRAACEAAINSLPAEWRAVEILVNNAGLAAGRDPVQSANMDDWDEMIDTNVKGLLHMTRLVAPLMIEAGGGHIINIGSLAGKETYPGGSAYCGTKFAVGAITRATRQDLAEFGIRVTNVAPGMAETEFSVVRFKGDEAKAKAVYEGITALHADDVADCIVWAATRPLHVNIDEIVLTPRAQADSRTVVRGKGY
jgi:NADP-dependent 3-hydroxy acid dehydrogenase YdfG